MKPGAFEYFRPATLDEAVSLLERYEPHAKVLAGGQSLVPLMNFRLARPAYIVDINGIEELSYIRRENGDLAIGALTRQSSIETSSLAAAHCPLLVEATRFIGHRTIRNRGTIGGSVAHADPAAEYPTALLALDGRVQTRGPEGDRLISAEELFITVCTTSLAPTELITEIQVPQLGGRTGWAFLELSRRHGDYAIIGVAAVISLDGSGVCKDARIAVAGVDQTPLRCTEAETVLRWNVPEPEVIREAAERCTATVQPQDDLHATARYKKAMTGVFVERAVRTAFQRAENKEHAS